MEERKTAYTITFLYFLVTSAFSLASRLNIPIINSFGALLPNILRVDSVWIITLTIILAVIRVFLRSDFSANKQHVYDATIRRTLGILLILDETLILTSVLPKLVYSYIATYSVLSNDVYSSASLSFVNILIANIFIFVLMFCKILLGAIMAKTKMAERAAINARIIYGVPFIYLIARGFSLIIITIADSNRAIDLGGSVTYVFASNLICVVAVISSLVVLWIKFRKSQNKLSDLLNDKAVKTACGFMLVIQGAFNIASDVRINQFDISVLRRSVALLKYVIKPIEYAGKPASTIASIILIILGITLLITFRIKANELRTYRISKYDPSNRDEKGDYRFVEWTSISDIGKEFGGNHLNYSSYTKAEDSYICAITLLMEHFNIDALYVSGLEKDVDILDSNNLKNHSQLYTERLIHTFRATVDRMRLTTEETQDICRLLLREDLRCKLPSDNDEFNVLIGYDFYMKIQCKAIADDIMQKIENEGLFVELIKFERNPQRTIHQISL